MLQIIEQLLRAGFEITFASAAVPGATRADLVALGVREQAIALNCSSFDEWVHKLAPAVVLFDRFMTEEQFGWRVAQQCPQALRVLETSDLHCLREARQMLLKQSLHDGHSAVPAVTITELYDVLVQQDIALREIAAILRCDLSLMISLFEINLLQDCFSIPSSLLVYCPFLLDAPDSARWKQFAEREHFLSIGNFLHAPNRDAVQWLKQQIWPRIRAQLPQAQLHVYGAYTPQAVREMHSVRDGFLVQGWTEDALDSMMQARVCLAPLRFGAGIKGKLADALLTGTPSVTTSIGAEAMHASLPWSGAVADDAETFSSEAVRLYRDENAWHEAQQQCQPLVQHCFDKRQHGDVLLTALQVTRDNLVRHRLHNFTGRMLQHHQHRSTEFMARWIEEKNRLR